MVAQALGPLVDALVFVGGCATGLLITDNARPAVRATQDVDLVAEVASKAEYYKLTDRLKEIGFRESVGDVLCRMQYGDLKVDVMPTVEGILNFGNRWYVHAVKKATVFSLPSRLQIRLISPPLLVATKIEAFYGRGNGDYGRSHDIEDILNLVDGRPELRREIEIADFELRNYLRDEVDELLATPEFVESISWHFNPAMEQQARIPLVIERLREIAGL